MLTVPTFRVLMQHHCQFQPSTCQCRTLDDSHLESLNVGVLTVQVQVVTTGGCKHPPVPANVDGHIAGRLSTQSPWESMEHNHPTTTANPLTQSNWKTIHLSVLFFLHPSLALKVGQHSDHWYNGWVNTMATGIMGGSTP